MIGVRVNDQASEETPLCAIALFADTELLNRELLGQAVDELAGFVLIHVQERCEYGRVRHFRPKAELRDGGGGELAAH
jgi:hypothetical protein